MKWIMVIVLVMSSFIGIAQKKEDKKKEEREVYTTASVEKMPEFSGGDIGMFIMKNMLYPAQSVTDGIEGEVLVKFIVSETGEMEDLHVQAGVSKELDEEALRVIGLMKQWKPGEIKGRKVAVHLLLPVSFRISD